MKKLKIIQATLPGRRISVSWLPPFMNDGQIKNLTILMKMTLSGNHQPNELSVQPMILQFACLE